MEATVTETSSAPTTARLMQKLGAEMVGTFALVFAGCGAVMVDGLTGGTITHVGVGMAFGLAIMVMIYATGHISGAHFNPAVTIAFAITRRFPAREVLPYITAQFLAGVVAAYTLRNVLGDVASVGATMPSGSVMQSFTLEVVLTFFLMFVIIAVASDARAVGQMAGLAIGGTVALAAIFGGPISGASMNPARSLGPALAAGDVSLLWLYFVAPIVGAGAGATVYELIRCERAQPAQVKGCC
jgi:MIP family channel proteins